MLGDVLDEGAERMVWLYTPMGLDVARSLRPALLVYDVMDDLASFRFAPPELALRQRQALREADVVFAGGRSLHRSVIEHRPSGTHCFPSGVEPEHFARAGRAGPAPAGATSRRLRRRHRRTARPRLIGRAGRRAARLGHPHGRTGRQDRPATLPQRANIVYPGCQPYAELPQVMAGFDVALMPFALNEATRSISPTKTLEYLAAGLRSSARRVPDVVADSRRGRRPRGRRRLRPGLPSGLRSSRGTPDRRSGDCGAARRKTVGHDRGRMHAHHRRRAAVLPRDTVEESGMSRDRWHDPREPASSSSAPARPGLGAGYRLQELGYDDWVILEANDYVGGLATSFTDEAGFTYDIGGHVMFSHYEYYDELVDKLMGGDFTELQREAWVWMEDRFIPYPFQNNIRDLEPADGVRVRDRADRGPAGRDAPSDELPRVGRRRRSAPASPSTS